MKRIKIAFLGLSVLCMVQSVGLASTVYRFEGPREANASIGETAASFDIEASLNPVTAFDKATNDQLNRSKLRGVAMMALTRHLDVPPTSVLSVSELRVTGVHCTPSRVVMKIEIPKAGARVVQRSMAAPVGTPNAATPSADTFGGPGGSPLLSRKGDYLDTLAQLQEAHEAAIADILTVGTQAEQLVGVNQSIVDQFDALQRAVDSDLLLPTIEREDVYAAMAAARAKLLDQLTDAQKLAKSSGGTPVSAEGPGK